MSSINESLISKPEEETEVYTSNESLYDPNEFNDIKASPEVKNLFGYITFYTPQVIDLELKLKPFIPDYIPAVGDIDAFIKIPRPDDVNDGLGLNVIDEPSSKNQSDPTLLKLHLKAIGKHVTLDKDENLTIKTASTSKEIDNWIENIRSLHETTASLSNVIPLISSQLPDIEKLMQEWDPEIEKALSEFQLPKADMDMTIEEYAKAVCVFLDIPVRSSKIASLHHLFNLYYEFQNSQHFKRI